LEVGGEIRKMGILYELENRRAPHEDDDDDDDDGDGEFRKLLTELDRATKEVNPSPIYRSKTSSLILRSFPEIFAFDHFPIP
jgi:hypothetical protein